MTPIGCLHFTGTPTEHGVVTAGNNETTPSGPDSFSASESRIGEVNTPYLMQTFYNKALRRLPQLISSRMKLIGLKMYSVIV